MYAQQVFTEKSYSYDTLGILEKENILSSVISLNGNNIFVTYRIYDDIITCNLTSDTSDLLDSLLEIRRIVKKEKRYSSVDFPLSYDKSTDIFEYNISVDSFLSKNKFNFSSTRYVLINKKNNGWTYLKYCRGEDNFDTLSQYETNNIEYRDLGYQESIFSVSNNVITDTSILNFQKHIVNGLKFYICSNKFSTKYENGYTFDYNELIKNGVSKFIVYEKNKRIINEIKYFQKSNKLFFTISLNNKLFKFMIQVNKKKALLKLYENDIPVKQYEIKTQIGNTWGQYPRIIPLEFDYMIRFGTVMPDW